MTAQLDTQLIHIDKFQQNQAAYLYAVKAHVDLHATYPDDITIMGFTVETPALVLQYRGNVVGVLAYTLVEQWNAAYVELAYIDEDYRGHGWYRRMWDDLVERSRAKRMSSIRGGTAFDNHKMQEVMAHFNRQPVSIHYTYQLEYSHDPE